MKVVVSAGGTGGHIYPALSIINKIKEEDPNSEFLYIGTHNRMEKDIIPKYDIPFRSIEIYGFNRKNIFKNIKTIFYLIKSSFIVKKWLKEFKPDIVIGCGGYVTYPVIKQAKKLKIKTFIHEQNSVPGMANLRLQKYTDLIGVSFKSTLDDFKKTKVVFTGNPCSENALKTTVASKSEFNIPEDGKTILFVMGSLGATTVNNIIADALPFFEGKNYYIIFVTGNNDFDRINGINVPSNVRVVPYIENMTRIMKNIDLMVTRAGASTLSEIIALKVPSILIPSPYVPNNHQYKNAINLVNDNAAMLLEEKDLTKEKLIEMIDETINNNFKLEELKNNLSKLNVDDSASIIYTNIKNLIDGNNI